MRTLPATTLLALVALSPFLAWRWFANDGDLLYAVTDTWPRWCVDQLLCTVFCAVFGGMAIVLATGDLTGRRATLATAFRRALSGAFALIAIALVCNLVPYVLVAVFSSPVEGSIDVQQPTDPADFAFIYACLAADWVIDAILAVAGAAIVLEGCGARSALLRSVALTRGARLRILACSLLIVLPAAIAMVLAFVAPIVFEVDTTAVARAWDGSIQWAATPIWATLAAVLYRELRTAKEGAEVPDLERVFA